MTVAAERPYGPALHPPSPVHLEGVDVAVVRTDAGWAVVSPDGAQRVADLVEGLCLADLVTEQFGGSVDPDRTARRSARGPASAGLASLGSASSGSASSGGDAAADPRDLRVAALERTVAQLEHALAARVSTERAIGVLAERHATTPRAAFESLRQSARSQGRAVVELAREVLDTLGSGHLLGEPAGAPPGPAGPSVPRPAGTARPPGPRVEPGADGRP